MRRNGEVTKQELIDTALKLQYKNGYDKISVKKIIDHVGISKGGFYHHFKSKEELFERMVLPNIMALKNTLQVIVNSDKLNALEKFNTIIVRTREFKASRKEMNRELVKIWLKGRIAFLVPQIITKYLEVITPLWKQVIEQGSNEGVFDTSDVGELTDLLLMIGIDFNRKMGEYFLDIAKNREKKQELLKIMEKKANFMEITVERLLGVSGKIQFAKPYMENVHFFVEDIVEPLGNFLEED